MRIARYVVLGGLGVGASVASAMPVTLAVDINALSAQASGPLSEDFTGTIQIFNTPQRLDGNAEILDLLVDGVRQNTPGALGTEFAFELSLEFDGGSITAGDLIVQVDATGSENSYSTAAVAVQDGSIIDAGGVFSIGGTTVGGAFDDALGTLLGVDVSPWGLAEPADGHFAVIGLDPNGQGFDPDADVDVFVLTPAPATLAVLLATFVAPRRRSRMHETPHSR